MIYEVVHKYCNKGDEFDSVEDARFAAPKDARIIVWRDGMKRERLMTMRWTRILGWVDVKTKVGYMR